MALNEINLKPKVSGSGGLWGKIAGAAIGLGGAVAAPFTGGATAAALPVAAGLVGGAAPIIGEAIDPQKVSGGKGTSLISTAFKVDPELQNLAMSDSQKALKDIPGLSVEDHKTIHSQLELAKQKNKERIQMALGVG